MPYAVMGPPTNLEPEEAGTAGDPRGKRMSALRAAAHTRRSRPHSPHPSPAHNSNLLLGVGKVLVSYERRAHRLFTLGSNLEHPRDGTDTDCCEYSAELRGEHLAACRIEAIIGQSICGVEDGRWAC